MSVEIARVADDKKQGMTDADLRLFLAEVDPGNGCGGYPGRVQVTTTANRRQRMSEITASEAPEWVERGQENTSGILSVTRRRGDWVGGAEIGLFDDDGSEVVLGKSIRITRRQRWYMAWKLIKAGTGR